MSILKGQFDIHIDSNHRWDTDRVMEIDAYPMVQNEDGTKSADTGIAIASVRIPSLDVYHDTWVGTDNLEGISDMPMHVRYAYNCIILLANAVQQEAAK